MPEQARRQFHVLLRSCEFYNDSVNTFNIRIQQMPDTFIASFMNLRPKSMFKVDEGDRSDVKMSFGAGA